MEKAIKKAIEGGYFDYEKSKHREWSADRENGRHVAVNFRDFLGKIDQNKLLLDPLFWTALGKAEGWKHGYDTENPRSGTYYTNWLSHWHRFIDHLAEGGDAESFFNSLLA